MKLVKIEDYKNEKGRFILLGDAATNGRVYCECHITWNRGNESIAVAADLVDGER